MIEEMAFWFLFQLGQRCPIKVKRYYRANSSLPCRDNDSSRRVTNAPHPAQAFAINSSYPKFNLSRL